VGMIRVAVMMGAVMAVGACTHVAGVVTRSNGKPDTVAAFSVGRPTDIVMYGEHPVDEEGKFSFYILPTDETNLYVYDKGVDPTSTIRQIRKEEISDHMQIKLDPSNLEMDPSLRAIP